MGTQLSHMGVFNTKIIEYSNGLVEVRKYSYPMNMHLMHISSSEIVERMRLGRELRRYNEIVEFSEKAINPFTGKIERMWDYEFEDVVKARKNESLRRSRNRTINAIYDLSRQCDWKYFITLTFSPDVIDRYDYDACMKRANIWFNNQRKRKAPDLQYLFVPERHKDCAWHIHGLIARVGDISFVDSGHRDKGKVVYNLDGWKNGFSTATVVYDVLKVSTYITKYITKELCEHTLGKKRYYRSQNIPKPKVTELLLEPSESNFDEALANSLGKSVVYEKSISGYVDIDYKYFY